MSYSVKTTSVFERQAKRLIRKYPSLKSELADLINSLKEHPATGTSLGNNCFKIRISVASKAKGKSGGTRVITNLVYSSKTVYLLNIFDKSEKANITDKELKELLKYLPE